MRSGHIIASEDAEATVGVDRRGLIGAVSAAAMVPLTGRSAEATPPWAALKDLLFSDRPLADGAELLRLEAPVRALDASIVPISVEATASGPERWIKTLWLVVDENPAPVVGVFHFQPDQGPAAIATRVRVNAYTPVHAIAEGGTGDLFVVERFVKAAGGCSAPALKDAAAAEARLGKMKLKTLTPFIPGEPLRAQLLISHPNYTGMQIDQVSRNWIMPDYITSIDISFAGRPVLRVDSDISLSEDPSLTFGFRPEVAGELVVEVQDSSERQFRQAFPLSVPS